MITKVWVLRDNCSLNTSLYLLPRRRHGRHMNTFFLDKCKKFESKEEAYIYLSKLSDEDRSYTPVEIKVCDRHTGCNCE